MIAIPPLLTLADAACRSKGTFVPPNVLVPDAATCAGAETAGGGGGY